MGAPRAEDRAPGGLRIPRQRAGWSQLASVARLMRAGEVYVLATRVRDLPPGLYHYRSDAHRLELVREGASARQIVRYLPTQGYFGKAAALMLMTAVFPRVQWKYEFPRAYRVVLADAGHLCQTFCLAATWLGLAPFCTMALADSKIEADLGLDGVTESVIYAAGVGVRPGRVGSSRKPNSTSVSGRA